MAYSTANPDHLRIYDPETEQPILKCMWFDKAYNPIPYAFRSEDDKLLVGTVGMGHGMLAETNNLTDYDIRTRGRFWCSKYITNWDARYDNPKSREVYRKIYDAFRQQLNTNIGNYIVLVEDYDGYELLAITLFDYIAGRKPVKLTPSSLIAPLSFMILAI